MRIVTIFFALLYGWQQQYRKKMINHFIYAHNYEFRFWEMADNLGG
jgi:thiaminase